MTRLLGGGVDDGEDVEVAAVRELEEELGVKVSPDDLELITRFDTHAVDTAGREFDNQTYLFSVDVANKPYRPGDDVEQIAALSKVEMYELADRFEQLPADLWHDSVEEGRFSWYDYGQMYSVIHRVAADAMN
ncbi:hypothetical protein CSA80_03195 [Candidatus Saccharibacteria bacterium]|nr:MAG: hypothetical protein CSA80_03195 [Candidatus Saccharibacteria bacterium]